MNRIVKPIKITTIGIVAIMTGHACLGPLQEDKSAIILTRIYRGGKSPTLLCGADFVANGSNELLRRQGGLEDAALSTELHGATELLAG